MISIHLVGSQLCLEETFNKHFLSFPGAHENRLFMHAYPSHPFSTISRSSFCQRTCASEITMTLKLGGLQSSSWTLDLEISWLLMAHCLTLHGSALTPLINHIYPDLHSNPPPAPSTFINHMILAPRNDDVHVLNHNMIDSFQASPANTKVYHSADSAIIWDELSDDIPVEFLNAINVSGMPVSKLTLKVGCPVILLHNLSTCDGLCNGTRAIIAVLQDRVV